MPRSALLLEFEQVLIAADHGGDPARLRLLPGVAEALRRFALRAVPVALCSERPREEAPATTMALLDALAARLEEAGCVLAGVHVVDGVAPPARRRPAPGGLLRALAAIQADGPSSWLVATRDDDARAAASAGCAGCVLVGRTEVPEALRELGIVVAGARDLADAPRVMVPRGGGCWHDTR